MDATNLHDDLLAHAGHSLTVNVAGNGDLTLACATCQRAALHVAQPTRPTYRELEQAIRTTLDRVLPGWEQDAHFYTPHQWRVREEPYNRDALLNMTFEGPLYHALNYGDGTVLDALNSALDQHGCYFEFGYAWCFGVYRNTPINWPTE